MSLVCRGEQHRLPHARADSARANLCRTVIRSRAASAIRQPGQSHAESITCMCAAPVAARAPAAGVRSAWNNCIRADQVLQLPFSQHSLGPVTPNVQASFGELAFRAGRIVASVYLASEKPAEAGMMLERSADAAWSSVQGWVQARPAVSETCAGGISRSRGSTSTARSAKPAPIRKAADAPSAW